MTVTQHTNKFMEGIFKALPLVQYAFTILGGIAAFIYFFGGFQTSQAAQIENLQKGQATLTKQVEEAKILRDADIRDIRDDLKQKADKKDIESLKELIMLSLEQSKEARDLGYKNFQK